MSAAQGNSSGRPLDIKFAFVQRTESWREFAGNTGLRAKFDVIHGFSISRDDLEAGLVQVRAVIRGGGRVWVSWSKRALKVATDIGRGTAWKICLPRGLADVKVRAMDKIWSGLKFNARRELAPRGMINQGANTWSN